MVRRVGGGGGRGEAFVDWIKAESEAGVSVIPWTYYRFMALILQFRYYFLASRNLPGSSLPGRTTFFPFSADLFPLGRSRATSSQTSAKKE